MVRVRSGSSNSCEGQLYYGPYTGQQIPGQSQTQGTNPIPVPGTVTQTTYSPTFTTGAPPPTAYSYSAFNVPSPPQSPTGSTYSPYAASPASSDGLQFSMSGVNSPASGTPAQSPQINQTLPQPPATQGLPQYQQQVTPYPPFQQGTQYGVPQPFHTQVPQGQVQPGAYYGQPVQGYNAVPQQTMFYHPQQVGQQTGIPPTSSVAGYSPQSWPSTTTVPESYSQNGYYQSGSNPYGGSGSQ
jgi:hypothetical protein